MKKIDKFHEAYVRDERIFLPGGQDPSSITEYPLMYGRYFGVGHRLYLCVHDEPSNEVFDICWQQINPRMMVEPLTQLLDDFKLIMVDCEMGGVSVFGPEKVKNG